MFSGEDGEYLLRPEPRARQSDAAIDSDASLPFARAGKGQHFDDYDYLQALFIEYPLCSRFSYEHSGTEEIIERGSKNIHLWTHLFSF